MKRFIRLFKDIFSRKKIKAWQWFVVLWLLGALFMLVLAGLVKAIFWIGS